MAREFTEQAKRLGVKVVASEFTTDKATDFSSILTNIRASKADAVFYGGYSPQGGPLLKQMRALGISGPLLGGDGICSSETANLSQISGDLNTFCTQGGSMLDRSDKGQKFAQLYRAEYKRDPLTYARRFLRRHAHAGCRHRVHNRPTPRRLCRPSPTASTLA